MRSIRARSDCSWSNADGNATTREPRCCSWAVIRVSRCATRSRMSSSFASIERSCLRIKFSGSLISISNRRERLQPTTIPRGQQQSQSTSAQAPRWPARHPRVPALHGGSPSRGVGSLPHPRTQRWSVSTPVRFSIPIGPTNTMFCMRGNLRRSPVKKRSGGTKTWILVPPERLVGHR